MQIGTFESSYPVMAAIRWTRQFHAMLSTPLRVRDLIVGHQLYIACRLAVVGAIYLAILAAFGALHSPLAILALPVVVLIGLAHSAPVTAFSAWLERDEGFNALFRFGVMPMFLFSGTFFPVTRLPHPFREVAYATPLWNGVDLTRHLTLGTATLWRVARTRRVSASVDRRRTCARAPHVPEEARAVTRVRIRAAAHAGTCCSSGTSWSTAARG